MREARVALSVGGMVGGSGGITTMVRGVSQWGWGSSGAQGVEGAGAAAAAAAITAAAAVRKPW